MLLWFLSKPIRPFGTIQRGWSSILGRGEVPRTSCFTSCFQLEWNCFFFWKEKKKGERETLPFFPRSFCDFRVSHCHMSMSMAWHNHSISSLCKLAMATLWRLFFDCPVFLPLLCPSLHWQRASAVSWNCLLWGDLWNFSVCIHWASCLAFLS